VIFFKITVILFEITKALNDSVLNQGKQLCHAYSASIINQIVEHLTSAGSIKADIGLPLADQIYLF